MHVLTEEEMMNLLDSLGAITLAVSATILMAVPAAYYLKSQGGWRYLAAHGLWFAFIVALVASGALAARPMLGAPLIGILTIVPVIAVSWAALRIESLRRALLTIPLPMVIATHTLRILGLFFVLLYAADRLPAPFATEAGWGDIIVGVLAPLAALALVRGASGARALAIAWNALGLLDLLAAVGLGITSAPGTPLQLFHDGPSTAIMGTLPWAMIPVFLVPNLMIGHLAVFRRLGAPSSRTQALHA
jgi:hypothetical protein